MMTDISDYFGFGWSKLPAHRDVTTCPCKGCQRTRGVMSGLQAQSEAVRFILYLKWLRWLHTKDRNERMRKR
jgi:hypothetical protein